MKKFLIPLLTVSFLLAGCVNLNEKATNDKIIGGEENDQNDEKAVNSILFKDINETFFINGIALGTPKEEVIETLGTPSTDDGWHTYQDLGLSIAYYPDDSVSDIRFIINSSDFNSLIHSKISDLKHSNSSSEVNETYLYYHPSIKQLLKVKPDSNSSDLAVNIGHPDFTFKKADWEVIFEDNNETFFFNGITLGMTKEEVSNTLGTPAVVDSNDPTGETDEYHTYKYEDLQLSIGYSSDIVTGLHLTISPSDFESVIDSNISAQKYSSVYNDKTFFYFHPSLKQILKVQSHPMDESSLIVYVLGPPDGNFNIDDWIPVQ